eukprot:IDg4100t1
MCCVVTHIVLKSIINLVLCMLAVLEDRSMQSHCTVSLSFGRWRAVLPSAERRRISNKFPHTIRHDLIRTTLAAVCISPYVAPFRQREFVAHLPAPATCSNRRTLSSSISRAIDSQRDYVFSCISSSASDHTTHTRELRLHSVHGDGQVKPVAQHSLTFIQVALRGTLHGGELCPDKRGMKAYGRGRYAVHVLVSYTALAHCTSAVLLTIFDVSKTCTRHVGNHGSPLFQRGSVWQSTCSAASCFCALRDN